jgi:hypothetical protein
VKAKISIKPNKDERTKTVTITGLNIYEVPTTEELLVAIDDA